MKVTNKYNLPDIIVEVARKFSKRRNSGNFSPTQLVMPRQILYLFDKKYDELSVDASEFIWAILGTSGHYFLEKHAPENTLVEEWIKSELSGYKLVCKPDMLEGKTLIDWKVTTVQATNFSKDEWEQQLNVNAYLFSRNGFDIDKLMIWAILRDWRRKEMIRDRSYPRIPMVKMEYPLWKKQYTENWILERIKYHQSEDIPECTKSEKWQGKSKFAVIKNGAKRAKRILNSFEGAQDFIIENCDDPEEWDISERFAPRTRCELYCQVREVCEQKKREDEKA